MGSNKKQTVTDKIESIQDGERYSQSIEKLTKNKRKLTHANNLEKQAYKNALEVGIVSPHEIIDVEKVPKDLADKLEAEKSLEKATGYKSIIFDELEKSDIDFINNLEENEIKYKVIEELFGKRISKQWEKKEKLPAVNGEKKLRFTPQSKKFVELYEKNYENILSGKSYKTDTELKKLAGYSDTVPAHYVKRIPWVALKIKNFHDTQRQIEEYHLQKIEDIEVRRDSAVADITMRYLTHLKANPQKLEKGSLRDAASALKVINELNGKNGKDKGPSIAIQINQDMGNVFGSQNEEKKEHMYNSFN